MATVLDRSARRIGSGVIVRWYEKIGFVIIHRHADGREFEVVRVEDGVDAARAYRVIADHVYAPRAAPDPDCRERRKPDSAARTAVTTGCALLLWLSGALAYFGWPPLVEAVISTAHFLGRVLA